MVALVTNFIAIAKIDKTREVETNTRRSCCYALKQYKMMRAMSPEKHEFISSFSKSGKNCFIFCEIL